MFTVTGRWHEYHTDTFTDMSFSSGGIYLLEIAINTHISERHDRHKRSSIYRNIYEIIDGIKQCFSSFVCGTVTYIHTHRDTHTLSTDMVQRPYPWGY